MEKKSLATIGFTKTTAESFFNRLQSSKIKTLIDVRLNNTSQLSGFAKSQDLKFFLKAVSNIQYRHLPILAPEEDMLKTYRNLGKDWEAYSRKFLDLMEYRRIETKLSPELLENSCLLCSEDKPHHCHRRLVAEYLNDKWGGALSIKHL
ncbi:MAG TPA: DUF488 domain-containing protein [Ramlibacter sp.]|jgi:uncharacterized protein (DUF488 family)